MFRIASLAALCALSVLVTAQPAFACSCGMPPVCTAFWNADRVFTGRAEVTHLGPGAQRTRFRIEQAFRGAPGAVEIDAQGLGGSCDFEFDDGVRYLVFAKQSTGGKWKVFLCSRTAPLDRARDDLAFAQMAVQDAGRGGKIYGVVHIAEPRPDGRITGVFTGATITLRSNADVLTAETSLRGEYEFKSVPPGRYTLSIRVTPQFESVPPATVTVEGPGACVPHAITVVRKRG